MAGMTARFGALIAPGLDRSIAIEWGTSHVASEIEGQAIVHFGDTSQAPVTLRLKGVVQPPLEILPFPAIFLSAFQGEDVERRLKIINHQGQPTVVSLSQPSIKHFTATLKELERGMTYEILAQSQQMQRAKILRFANCRPKPFWLKSGMACLRLQRSDQTWKPSNSDRTLRMAIVRPIASM